jgi:hypothetical protein
MSYSATRCKVSSEIDGLRADRVVERRH